MKNQDPSLSRLRWACRRGMLELDVLLGKFLEEVYTDLTPEDQAHFVNLLNCTDPEIHDWLMGSVEPDDVHLKRITGLIRKHARREL